MRRSIRRLAGLVALLLPLAPAAARDTQNLPPGFVALRAVAPTIAQDMRYAGFDNFTGAPVPGYRAAICVLRRDAAQALARAAADLAREGLGLKVYDCYRPQRAVHAFMTWVRQPESNATRRFYPTLDKRDLFKRGYIAAHSRHSAGIAVDLTLVHLPAPPQGAYDRNARYGICTAPAALRAPDNSLDMGTGFDCLDGKSHTRSPAITPEQRARRDKLAAVMRRHGFKPYFREWWHFEFASTASRRPYDIPLGR
jgi:D-alanyl-D-alanine dipeptidase